MNLFKLAEYRQPMEAHALYRAQPFTGNNGKSRFSMSISITIAAIWVMCATATALLPMRHQYMPGVTLLVLAPVLIGWIGVDFGLVGGVLAFAGFASMFRNPLKYFYARARGLHPELPK